MKKSKKFSLAAAFAELEKIVNDLESNPPDLETSLEKFRRGVKLSQQIKKRLAEIKNEIKVIRQEE